MKKTKVFIDTNFWLIPHRYKIDIFSELDRLSLGNYEPVISKGVIKELEGIRRSAKGEDKIAANVGLELIKRRKLKVLLSKTPHQEEDVDKFILAFAEKGDNKKNFIVCTNDKELREKLKTKGVRVIIMKEKKKLDFFLVLFLSLLFLNFS